MPASYALCPGGRRQTLAMLAARERADRFAGLAPGSAKPLRLLAAFQEAEPYLGLPRLAFKLVAWLVKMTRPGDWEEGSRPVAWPSAERQQEFLGLGASAVKALNRALAEAGVLAPRDSPSGKRYGRRDAEGRLVEAYGFDLSPLAYRYDEFLRLAAAAGVARERARALRRRATTARRALAALFEAGIGGELAAETAALVARLPKARDVEALSPLVAGLERLQAEAEARWKAQAEPVSYGPEGSENRPLTRSTNEAFYPPDTVAASQEMRSEPVNAPVRPEELLRLAPRLAAHLPGPYGDWRGVIDAAGGGLARELGVAPRLWGEACLKLGRPAAAVALAIVSTKPPQHFRRGAGGYFAALVARHERGELRLDRSLWRLRREAVASGYPGASR